MQVVKKWTENTNNDWGFGGYNATFTEYDNGIIERKGRYSHRHTGTSSADKIFIKVYEDFEIPVRKNANGYSHVSKLKDINCVSVFYNEKPGHAVAINKDLDNFELYGETYTLIKKVIV